MAVSPRLMTVAASLKAQRGAAAGLDSDGSNRVNHEIFDDAISTGDPQNAGWFLSGKDSQSKMDDS